MLKIHHLVPFGNLELFYVAAIYCYGR